jgi:hypothetical protein
MPDEEYEESLREVEPVRYGFQSKATQMAEGKANVNGTPTKKQEKKKKKQEKRYMHPTKKPGIARYIPKPIQVARQYAMRNALGVPNNMPTAGFHLNPVTVFKKETAPTIRDPLFGNVKVDAKGRRRLF